MDPVEVAAAATEAEARAEREGVHGKARTPFLLAALAELTGGRSLEANLALLEDNARVAGGDRRRAQRSQVWMMTLEKFQPYLSDFGFFDLPPARARIVIGTSTMRAWWRSASIRISLVQNWSCSRTSGRSRSARAAR